MKILTFLQVNLFLFLITLNISFAQKIELLLPSKHKDHIKALAFSEDKQFLASASADKTIKIWSLTANREFRTLRTHDKNLNAILFDVDKKLLISGGDYIQFWNWETGELIYEYHNHGDIVQSMNISPDHKYLAVDLLHTTIVWKLNGKRKVFEIKDQGQEYADTYGKINQIMFHPLDRDILVTGSTDDLIRFWSISKQSLLQEMGIHNSKHRFMLSEDGRDIYQCTQQKSTGLMKKNLKTFASETISKGFESSAWERAFNYKSQQLFTYILNTSKGMIQFLYPTYTTIEIQAESYNKYTRAVLSSDGQWLAVSNGRHISDKDHKITDFESTINIYDTQTGKLEKNIIVFDYPRINIQEMEFSQNGTLLATSGHNRPLNIWELDQPFGFISLKDSVTTTNSHVHQLQFDTENHILYQKNDLNILQWNIKNGKLLKNYPGDPSTFYLSDDKSQLFISGGSHIRVSSGKKEKYANYGLLLDKKQSILYAYGQYENFHRITRTHESKNIELPFISIDHKVSHVTVHPQKPHIAYYERSGKCEVKDFQSGKILYTQSHTDAYIMSYSPEGQYLAYAIQDTLVLLETTSYEIKYRLLSHDSPIQSIAFNPKHNLLASSASDGIKLWSLKNGQLLATLLPIGENDFIIATPELYYMATKKGVKGVYFRNGEKVLPFEQFDLPYNRPDIVLKKIGLATEEMIIILRNAYEKRVKKLGFQLNQIKKDLHLPEIKILNKDSIPQESQQREIQLQLLAKDKQYPIDRIYLYINGVPVNGSKGISLRSQNTSFLRTTLPVQLSGGYNKIQISVLNEKGAESLKETLEVYYPLTPPKDLHIISIGVNQYLNTMMNLSYASKDAKDVVEAFQKHPKDYQHIYVHELYDTQATKENILQLKEIVQKTKIDDVVLLFIAGHGLLDQELNYYFGTYDIDPEKPENRGLPYEDLELLLDDIPARNKVVFIDACHAGELDKEEIEKGITRLIEHGKVTFRDFTRFQLQYQKIGLKNSFLLAKKLFTDLRKHSGATIIASAGGVEYAWEGEEWKNGIFTYSLLKGLKEKQADSNQDQKITLSELQNFLQEKVYELTKGLQQPTSRIENIDNDFEIW